jgi:hypothetical protein
MGKYEFEYGRDVMKHELAVSEGYVPGVEDFPIIGYMYLPIHAEDKAKMVDKYDDSEHCVEWIILKRVVRTGRGCIQCWYQ